MLEKYPFTNFARPIYEFINATTPKATEVARPIHPLSIEAHQEPRVAAVEAAFCFPLITILMMGTLEVCTGFISKSQSPSVRLRGFVLACTVEPRPTMDHSWWRF